MIKFVLKTGKSSRSPKASINISQNLYLLRLFKRVFTMFYPFLKVSYSLSSVWSWYHHWVIFEVRFVWNEPLWKHSLLACPVHENTLTQWNSQRGSYWYQQCVCFNWSKIYPFMICWCRRSNSSEAEASHDRNYLEHFCLSVFASNNKLTLAYLYKKLTVTDNGCLGTPKVQTCHWFKAFWTCSILKRDALVWRYSLNT